MNTSVARNSFSWLDNRTPAFFSPPNGCNTAAAVFADVFDLIPPAVGLERVVSLAVHLSFLRVIVRVSASDDDLDGDPRRRFWRVRKVVFEHVDVDLTACFSDSTGESETNVVTVIEKDY